MKFLYPLLLVLPLIYDVSSCPDQSLPFAPNTPDEPTIDDVTNFAVPEINKKDGTDYTLVSRLDYQMEGDALGIRYYLTISVMDSKQQLSTCRALVYYDRLVRLMELLDHSCTKDKSINLRGQNMAGNMATPPSGKYEPSVEEAADFAMDEINKKERVNYRVYRINSSKTKSGDERVHYNIDYNAKDLTSINPDVRCIVDVYYHRSSHTMSLNQNYNCWNI